MGVEPLQRRPTLLFLFRGSEIPAGSMLSICGMAVECECECVGEGEREREREGGGGGEGGEGPASQLRNSRDAKKLVADLSISVVFSV